MKRIAILWTIILCFVGCKEADQIIPPSSSSFIDWEGHGGAINESYKDSILFLSTRNSTYLVRSKIHIMYKSGQGLRSVPSDSFLSFQAATWSPKKWKILFLADTYNTRAIYSVDCDWKNCRRIPAPSQIMIPSLDWSPDGQKIAYVEIDASLGCRVGVMNPDGTSPVGISSWYPIVYRVSWSPSSSEIVFSPLDSTGGRIMIIKSDGTGLRSLVTGLNAAYPSWSPDGRYIAFVQNFSKIFIHDLNTHQNTQLTFGQNYDSWPTWSSDSRTIVFSSRPGVNPSPSAIHSIQIDGTNRLALTDTLATDFYPVWQK